MSAPLPTVEGVGPSRRRLPEGPWETVLEFLLEQYPAVGEAAWRARMAKGSVTDADGRRLDPASPYRAGACVFYYREVESEPRIPFEERVIHQDEHVLVADKPHFLPVTPSGPRLRESLLVRLKRKTGAQHLVPVHRLDRETAGVVLFSLDPATRGAYAALFRERKVEKVYEALAPAPPPGLELPLTRRSRIVEGEPFFRMREVEGEPNSETRVESIEGRGDATLYKLAPATGRKHQLRLHLAALGTPILNDRLYPEITRADEEDFSCPLKLLARSLSFRDPLTGRERRYVSGREL